MPEKYKNKLDCGSENRKKLYHSIRELRKMAKSEISKLNNTVSELPEKVHKDNRRKERNKLFRKDKTETVDATDNFIIASHETEDIPTRIDKKIQKFFYKDTGFKNYARYFVEDVDVCIETSDTTRSLYIIAYNSKLSMIEDLFISLKEDIAQIDPDNEYDGYLDNPVYRLAEEFTKRIKDDCLDRYEGIDFETYSQRLRLYAEDLDKRMKEIFLKEDV